MYLRCVIRLFYGNQSTVLLLLPVFASVFVALNYFFPTEFSASINQDSWWGLWIDESNLFSRIFAFLFVIGNAVFINFIFNKHQFKDRNMYMPSLLYVLVHSFFHSFYFFNVQSVLSTIIILIVYQLFQLDQNQDGRKRVFNIGLFIGFGCAIYPLFLVMFLPILISIWVLRPFVIREIILFFAGIIIPILYVVPFLMYFKLELFELLFAYNPIGSNKLSILMLGTLLLLFALVILPKFFARNSKSSIKQKKFIRITLILLFSLLGFLILEYLTFSIWECAQLILIPLILILSYSFGEKKPETLALFVTYLLIALALAKPFLIQLS